MGEVYVAEETRLRRRVALKFLRSDLQGDVASRERLISQHAATSAPSSPNIAVTYDFVEHEGVLFIAMEYVEGELISARLTRGPLLVREAVDVAAKVADALDEAHGHGIIHRDIKNANL